MPITLAELATRYNCRLEGSGDTVVNRVATLGNATPDSISFLANPAYREQLKSTRAAAVILEEPMLADCPVASLVSDNPYAAFARIAGYLHPVPAPTPGIDPSANVAADAVVSDSAEIGPLVAIGQGARIGDAVVVGAGSVIGANAAIGAGSRLAPNVTLLDSVSIGERCVLYSGVVVGSDGFGFAREKGVWTKVPQVGSVVIGNDVEIGANSTIDRGTIEATTIEDGVKLDNLVQIAHNVRVGAHTIMAAMSGAAGSTKIGQRCMVSGGTVMINHLEICDDVMFLFRSVVTRSVTEPGVYGGSLPAEEAAQWRRNAARFRTQDKMHARLRQVEDKLKKLSQNIRDEKDD